MHIVGTVQSATLIFQHYPYCEKIKDKMVLQGIGLHIAGAATCTCNVSSSFFVVVVVFVSTSVNWPTGICERTKQFFEEAAVAMLGGRKT